MQTPTDQPSPDPVGDAITSSRFDALACLFGRSLLTLGSIMHVSWIIAITVTFCLFQLAPLVEVNVYAAKLLILCTACALLSKRSFVLAVLAFVSVALVSLPITAPTVHLDDDTAYAVMVIAGVFVLCAQSVSWFMQRPTAAKTTTPAA